MNDNGMYQVIAISVVRRIKTVLDFEPWGLMNDTLFGIDIYERLLHLKKVSPSMLVTLFGIVMLVRLVHPTKT